MNKPVAHFKDLILLLLLITFLTLVSVNGKLTTQAFA